MENKDLTILCIIIVAVTLIVCGGVVYFTSFIKQTQLTTDLLEINQGDNLTITLTDENGQPLANKNVHITINGQTYNKTTDNVGKTQIQINLNPGDYEVGVTFDGDFSYKSSNITAPLKVLDKSASNSNSDNSWEAQGYVYEGNHVWHKNVGNHQHVFADNLGDGMHYIGTRHKNAKTGEFNSYMGMGGDSLP